MKPKGVLCKSCGRTGRKCICLEPVATTDEEKAVVLKLVEAYEMWLKLPDKNTNELEDFIYGIHRCQDVIRGRVAKRVDPEFWV